MKTAWTLATLLVLVAPAGADGWKLDMRIDALDMEHCHAMANTIEDFIGRAAEYRCIPDETGGRTEDRAGPSGAGEEGGRLSDPPLTSLPAPAPGTLLLPFKTDPSRVI